MTGSGNWTYLLRGATPALIDAGPGTGTHFSALEREAGATLASVLVTHGHADHAGGAAGIARRWPAARFAKLPWPGRDGQFDVPWTPLSDGARVAAGDVELEVLHTPGHTPDHVALWHAPSGTLFGGDLLVLGTTVFISASGGGRLVDYLHSLRRILALRPRRVLPAHGPAIEDPEALIEHYLEHRHQREHQVLTALEGEPRTIDQLVERIYPGLHDAVVPMARETILAHLQKLDHEGLARVTDERWSVVT